MKFAFSDERKKAFFGGKILWRLLITSSIRDLYICDYK